MAAHFIKKNRCGGSNVQGIHIWRHRNGDRFIARGEHGRRDAIAFAAKDDAAVTREIGLWQDPFIRVWMRRDAANAASTEIFEALNQRQVCRVRFLGELMPQAELGQLNDWQLQQRAHGIADGAAEEWTA